MAKTDIRGGTTGQVRSGTLTNLDIADGASISGSKISASFGAQNVDISTGQTYRVNGTPISSANLSNDSSLLKTSLLTTEGDLYYRNSSAVVRLPRGAEGYVLKVSGTALVWAEESGGGVPADAESGVVSSSSSGVVGTSTDYAREDHSHDLGSHGHTGASNGGDLSGTYSLLAHNHAGTYEPAFSKNTAFNDNYGTEAGTVCQGNDGRLSDARTPTAHDHDTLYPRSADTETISGAWTFTGGTTSFIGDGATVASEWYNYGSGINAIRGYAADGSLATPASIGDDEILLQLSGRGYHTQGTPGFSATRVAINFRSAEAFTDAAQGTKIEFRTTAAGTTSSTDVLILGPDKLADFAGQVKIQGGTPGAGKVLTDVGGTGLATWETPASISPADAEPGTVSSSTSGVVGSSADYAREDHSHDLGAHAHTGATDGGDLSGTYSVIGHNHTGTYEPAFTKNTAFNDNYGTEAGTVCQGNDGRLSDARTPTAHVHVAGSDTHFQYNNGGAHGGASGLRYDDATGYVGFNIAPTYPLHQSISVFNDYIALIENTHSSSAKCLRLAFTKSAGTRQALDFLNRSATVGAGSIFSFTGMNSIAEETRLGVFKCVATNVTDGAESADFEFNVRIADALETRAVLNANFAVGVNPTTQADSRASGSIASAASLFLGNLAGDPSAPVAGQTWFNATDSQFKGYNGSAIVILG